MVLRLGFSLFCKPCVHNSTCAYNSFLMPQQGNSALLDSFPWFAESTNERVAFYSIASLLIVVALGVWQLWYLRSFFQRKKIL